MAPDPVVSVIVPHFLGDVLLKCLGFLYSNTTGVPFEVIVADDRPYDDGSLQRAQARFPGIRVVSVGGGKGMGAGCNRGLEVARGKYAMLLNNDVEVADGWLPPLLAAMEADPRVGVCQPKVRSLRERGKFDYGGAAGGMMDMLGYTFCLGRLFQTVEEDRGQYDRSREIFWAVGGAMFLRVGCLRETGLMDERFYMHMEEIDLCWRFHLVGYKVKSVPESLVYHYGGWSLDARAFRKAYLNHRNQLVMVLKNLSALSLAWVLPARVLMELSTVLLGMVKRDWKRPAAALCGLSWVLFHPVEILRRRREAQRVRVVSDREVFGKVYRGVVGFRYFLGGVRRASDLDIGSGKRCGFCRIKVEGGA